MTIPRPALLLGWAGVIPFAFLSASSVLGVTQPLDPRVALLAYGAAILSFMGGAQWGIAVRSPDGFARDWTGYAVSVVPGLLAWLALLIGARVGLFVLVASFAGLLGYDLWTARTGIAPAWYGRLRVQLTAAVVPLLLLACA